MAWHPDYFRLFISHVSECGAFASQVAAELQAKYAIHGFVAHLHIVPSAVWQIEVENSLNSMDALAALLTPGFDASRWCNQEVGWALGRSTLAFSVRLGEDPQGFVGKFQAISGGDGNPVGIAQRVFEVLADNPATAGQIGVATAKWLRRAQTWEEIRYYIAPALDRVKHFSDLALDNLQAAFIDEERVRSSFYLGGIRAKLVASGRHVP